MNTIIPIDIYNTDIMVHFGDPGSLKEELVARFGLEDAQSIFDGLDFNDNLLGKTVLLSQGNIILWMPSVPQTAKEKGTMAHEIFHAACEIMTKIDVQPCEENEEVYAYLIGYLTKKIDEAITKKS